MLKKQHTTLAGGALGEIKNAINVFPSIELCAAMKQSGHDVTIVNNRDAPSMLYNRSIICVLRAIVTYTPPQSHYGTSLATYSSHRMN